MTLLLLSAVVAAFVATWLSLPIDRGDRVYFPAKLLVRGDVGSDGSLINSEFDRRHAALQQRVIVFFGGAAAVVLLIGVAFGARHKGNVK